MHKHLRLAIMLLPAVLPARQASADITIDFEDLGLATAGQAVSNSDPGFTSGGAFFNNDFDSTFNVFSGWAYSSINDVTTFGIDPNTFAPMNQFGAYNLPTGTGAGGSRTYGVAFNFSPNDAYINLPDGLDPVSAFVTNTTYAALTIRDGDPPSSPFQFAKKFGGPSGNDPDFFLLSITGYSGADATGTALGQVDFFLADYRFADNAQDYIIDAWTLVDLSSLIGARSLGFALASTDVGDFGMNTPAYFALDDLTLRVVPEPGSLALLATAGVGLGAWWWARRHAASGSEGRDGASQD